MLLLPVDQRPDENRGFMMPSFSGPIQQAGVWNTTHPFCAATLGHGWLHAARIWIEKANWGIDRLIGMRT